MPRIINKHVIQHITIGTHIFSQPSYVFSLYYYFKTLSIIVRFRLTEKSSFNAYDMNILVLGQPFFFSHTDAVVSTAAIN